MSQDELGDHAHPAPVSLTQEEAKVAQAPVRRMDLAVVGNVIAVVTQGRGIEGKKPEGRDAEALQVVELLNQTLEVADPVPVAVMKGPHVGFVYDRVLVPSRLVVECLRAGGSSLPCDLGGGHERTFFDGIS
jgi:hypothetical protein